MHAESITDRRVRKFEGVRWLETQRLPMVEIVALVKRDLAQARADGRLPAHLGLSVTCPSCNHTPTLTISVSNLAASDVERDEAACIDQWSKGYHPAFQRTLADAKTGWATTEAFDGVVDLLHGLLLQYGYDDSDIRSDHFDRRFYDEVRVDETSFLKAILAARAALGEIVLTQAPNQGLRLLSWKATKDLVDSLGRRADWTVLRHDARPALVGSAASVWRQGAALDWSIPQRGVRPGEGATFNETHGHASKAGPITSDGVRLFCEIVPGTWVVLVSPTASALERLEAMMGEAA